MTSRWDYPNFNPWVWDEAGDNELTREAYKIVDGRIPFDKEVMLMLLMDAKICHLRINCFKEDTLRGRTRKLFRRKGDK